MIWCCEGQPKIRRWPQASLDAAAADGVLLATSRLSVKRDRGMRPEVLATSGAELAGYDRLVTE
jgi:hypothetical protein